MTVVLTLANGITETFETDKYVISSPKDFHPMICKVEVFDNGKKIASKKRRCVCIKNLLLIVLRYNNN